MAHGELLKVATCKTPSISKLLNEVRISRPSAINNNMQVSQYYLNSAVILQNLKAKQRSVVAEERLIHLSHCEVSQHMRLGLTVYDKSGHHNYIDYSFPHLDQLVDQLNIFWL